MSGNPWTPLRRPHIGSRVAAHPAAACCASARSAATCAWAMAHSPGRRRRTALRRSGRQGSASSGPWTRRQPRSDVHSYTPCFQRQAMCIKFGLRACHGRVTSGIAQKGIAQSAAPANLCEVVSKHISEPLFLFTGGAGAAGARARRPAPDAARPLLQQPRARACTAGASLLCLAVPFADTRRCFRPQTCPAEACC